MDRRLPVQVQVRAPRAQTAQRLWLAANRVTSTQQSVAPHKRSPPPRVCICQRPKAMVVCCRCGFQIMGRVRTVCPEHPNTIFLMDLEHCPNCLMIMTIKETSSDQDS